MARKPKISNSPAIDIETTDLSEIRPLGNDDEQWLRRLAHYANTGDLTVSLSGKKDTDPEPLLRFDTTSNSWWTGRYVGEVQFEGRTLRIAPRFGDIQLFRWMSRIWGVKLAPIQGQYSRSKLWIWHLIARLWESQLVSAAKHGLPTRRTDKVHIGRSVRGRLDVRGSVKQFSAGKQLLVSRSREKCVDQAIAGVLTCAWMHLHEEVAKSFKQTRWLSPNADDLVSRLRAGLECNAGDFNTNARVKIRYTPITESYRPVVELSQAILANRGWYYSPHLIKRIEGYSDTAWDRKFKIKHFTTVDPRYFQYVIDGMSDVTKPGGTANGTGIEGIEICAKTGTAQNPHGKDHSIYIAFAPKDNPKIAIAVLVENGGFGATWAAPIANLMIEKYINGTAESSKPAMEERIKTSTIQ